MDKELTPLHDVVIIGGGPAGMTAALYALRANRSALMLEKNAFGGQIAYSPKVENYPGTDSLSGSEFADRLFQQVTRLGAEFDIAEAVGIRDHGAYKAVLGEDGTVYEGRSVIIAAGAKHRRLNVPGESELEGRGICYCAVCDGDFYRGKRVAMVGGGNTALQEALFLSDLCEHVTVIQNLDFFTGEERLARALMRRENVRCLFGAQVSSIEGDHRGLSGVHIRLEKTGEELRIPLDGLFVAIGLEPENGPFAGVAGLNEYGYIASDETCLTGTPGVFAAGDCRSKGIRQLTTAMSDGTVAADRKSVV